MCLVESFSTLQNWRTNGNNVLRSKFNSHVVLKAFLVETSQRQQHTELDVLPLQFFKFLCLPVLWHLGKKKYCNYCALFPTLKVPLSTRRQGSDLFFPVFSLLRLSLRHQKLSVKFVVEACLNESPIIQVSLLLFLFSKLTFLFWYSICRYLLDRKDSPNPRSNYVFGV